VGLNLSAFADRKDIKQCHGPCGKRKLKDDFWANPKNADGKSNQCIECTKEARRERRRAKEEGRPLSTMSEEHRRAASERMKRMHADGIAGPAYGSLGGRPRKIRISDAVLEHMRGTPQVALIIRAYESNLRSNSKVARLRAAEAIAAMEIRNEEAQAKLRGAGKSIDELSDAELQEMLEQGVTQMIERGEIQVPGYDVETTAQDMDVP
jgi:hypothetical protein